VGKPKSEVVRSHAYGTVVKLSNLDSITSSVNATERNL